MQELYFEPLVKKEQMEEKMRNIKEVKCRVVTCKTVCAGDGSDHGPCLTPLWLSRAWGGLWDVGSCLGTRNPPRSFI